MSVQTLGVDFGGVVAEKTDGKKWPSVVSGAFEALRRLKEEKFGDRVFVVSHCSTLWLKLMTLVWLELHLFYRRTGISRSHVRFCQRIEEKAGICGVLGITCFVDDRLEVLSTLTEVETLYLFRPSSNEVKRFIGFLPFVQKVNSWQEILERELA